MLQHFFAFAVKLDPPMISLSSPYAMVVYSPDEISVAKGSSFSIICSTVSKYPGGYFYLTRSEKSVSEAQPAYGHAVFYRSTFDFQQVEYTHQGGYTCVFGINISSSAFYSAPSKSLQVIVTGENLEHSRPFANVLLSLSSLVPVFVLLLPSLNDLTFPAATSSTSPLSGVLIALLVIILAMIGGYFVWKRRSQVTGMLLVCALKKNK